MKQSKKGSSQTILWWVVWICLTIGSFFVATAVWTPFIARHFGSIHDSRNSVLWIVAVFGTWMAILLPLIVAMYHKVDKAYEDARMAREKAAMKFRSVFVERSRRLLSEKLKEKLEGRPETIEGGHLVAVLLRDGRKIPNVFVAHREEILGIYDFTEMPFEASEIVGLEVTDPGELPVFFMSNWLRLDGVTAS